MSEFDSFSEFSESIDFSALAAAVDADPTLVENAAVATATPIGVDDDDGVATDVDVHSVLPSHVGPVPIVEDAAAAAAAAMPPPPPRPAKSAEEQAAAAKRKRKAARVGFDVTGETLFSGASLIHKKGGELLHEMATLETLSTIPLKQSATTESLILECERLIFEHTPPSEPATTDDLRKLIALYDDFVFEYRPEIANAYDVEGGATDLDEPGAYADETVTFNRAHQTIAFIATMRLIYALQIALPDELNASRLLADSDSYSLEAASNVTDRMLARWLLKTGACHRSIIASDVENAEYPLRLRECSLEALWQTIRALLREFPRLAMCAELVRFFDELRCRVAFFMSYRELAPDELIDEDDEDDDDDGSDEDGARATLTFEQKLAQRNNTIMGLNLRLYGLLDLDTMTQGANHAVSNSRRAELDASERSLIDNWELAKLSECRRYVHVNMDFVDECERALFSIHEELRKQCGFLHAELPDLPCGLCGRLEQLLPPEVQRNRSLANLITEKHEQNLIDAISVQLKGQFSMVIEDEFKSDVFPFYVQPGELQQFKEYHPQETDNEQSCISKNRLEDFKVLSKRFLEPDVNKAWSVLGLEKEKDEPAHALLVSQTLQFMMRQEMEGVKFKQYYILCNALLPLQYHRSRSNNYRFHYYEIYDEQVTTSTLRARFKMGDACTDEKEICYEHPLVLRTINSHAVFYRGHMHRCRSFEHAYLLWLATMCFDKHLGGFSTEGKAMQPFATRLMPELSHEFAHSLRVSERRRQKWSPTAQIVDTAADCKRAQHTDLMSQF